MSWVGRLLAGLAPSVPPVLQARCLAAMEGRTLTPAPGRCGEAAPGAGHNSAATELDSTPPVAAGYPPPAEKGVHPSRRAAVTDAEIHAWLSSWATQEGQS